MYNYVESSKKKKNIKIKVKNIFICILILLSTTTSISFGVVFFKSLRIHYNGFTICYIT